MPQGNLAERMRAAGAGIGAFFCPTGVGTPLAEGKETREIDGRTYVLEYPIHGDVALIGAHRADRMGNLVYRKTARNFGPVMATAATTVDRPGARGRGRRRARPRGGRDAGDLRRPGGRACELDRSRCRKDEMAAAGRPRHPAPGSYVNLGIGQPTLVADHLQPGSGVVLHTENGMLNMGPAAHGDEDDPDLTNAGKIPVTELPGASYFHHADSFAMMRGGHLDVCVLGAFQVSAGGDLANWHTGAPDAIPAVGGAMDLAIGAKQVFVMMTPVRQGRHARSWCPSCTYPLTGVGCVDRVYTDARGLRDHPRRGAWSARRSARRTTSWPTGSTCPCWSRSEGTSRPDELGRCAAPGGLRPGAARLPPVLHASHAGGAPRVGLEDQPSRE